MSTEIAPATAPPSAAVSENIERVLITGDLARLTAQERLDYYLAVCRALNLNPYTRPFDYLTLQGKLILYARKDAAEQLRKLHGVSIRPPRVEITDGLCIVTVEAQDQTGRTDADLGIVCIDNLRGEARANAVLKAITKAKRRVTLSICGLGMLDETEIESIPDARPVPDAPLPAPPAVQATLDAAADNVPTDRQRQAIANHLKRTGLTEAAACHAVGVEGGDQLDYLGAVQLLRWLERQPNAAQAR